ncbi:hypothetical protein ABBQ38_011009 [Trebouxia sp. C0009 RCD-2024]
MLVQSAQCTAPEKNNTFQVTILAQTPRSRPSPRWSAYLPQPCRPVFEECEVNCVVSSYSNMSEAYNELTRIQGYRPAAVLLHTAETDAAILDLADHLGVGCEQLPAPGVLRKSVRSVWDSVSTAKVFFVTTEAANTLRLAPTFARRLNAEGTLCRINLQGFASLVEQHCPTG